MNYAKSQLRKLKMILSDIQNIKDGFFTTYNILLYITFGKLLAHYR